MAENTRRVDVVEQALDGLRNRPSWFVVGLLTLLASSVAGLVAILLSVRLGG